jgi:hypothetical protein
MLLNRKLWIESCIGQQQDRRIQYPKTGGFSIPRQEDPAPSTPRQEDPAPQAWRIQHPKAGGSSTPRQEDPAPQGRRNWFICLARPRQAAANWNVPDRFKKMIATSNRRNSLGISDHTTNILSWLSFFKRTLLLVHDIYTGASLGPCHTYMHCMLVWFIPLFSLFPHFTC